MSSTIRVRILATVFILGAICMVSPARACPEHQHEECPLGVCVCVPNIDEIPQQVGNAVNQLPDTLNVVGAVVHGDVNKLSQAVGGLVVKSTCPACDVFAQNVMSKEDKQFAEKVIGRGWLLYVGGADPVLILADAASSTAQKHPIERPQQSPIPAPPPKARGKKGYRSSNALCAVTRDHKATAGWVDAPVLTDTRTGTSFTFPTVDLRKGDTIEVTSSNECPAVPDDQKLVHQITLVYDYLSIQPGSDTTMKYFVVGSVTK